MALTSLALTGGSVPNWQLLQTSTPSGVSTVTFSGLSGYSKYRIMAPKLVCTVGVTSLSLQLNGDSGSNYSSSLLSNQNTAAAILAITSAGTLINLGAIGLASGNAFEIEIDQALIAAPKFVTAVNLDAINVRRSDITGYYNTTAALTSVTLSLVANNFSTGSIYLLGAN